ncbi:cytochrome P450 4F12-like [Acanthaster planci]|uniref:Cytochrome P450 4F12-like n=1 Tax=Acanthaster planci TaxID=133434 RepID=A0A8B7Z4G9_ACAPL|nr:cytochrome P450 4F12-like [Acanthaster planci]
MATEVSQLTKLVSFLPANWCGVLFSLLSVSLLYLLVRFIQLLRWKQAFRYALRDFPRHPNGSWLLGDVPEYTKGHNGMGREFHFNYEEVTDAMQFWLGPFMPGVVVFSPETVKAVANKNEPKQESVMRFLQEWIGDGLVASYGEKWARNRRLVSPAFHYSGLRPHVNIFSECAHRLVESVRGTKCVRRPISHTNVRPDTYQCTYVSAVRKLADLFFKRFVTMWQYFDFLFYNCQDGKDFRRILKVALDFSKQVIIQRRSLAKESQKRAFRDLLDILIDARDDEGKGLSGDEIQNEVNTFMFGGYETTSTAATWALYCLAQHPEYQDICRKEVDELMNAKGSEHLDWTDMNCLPFLTMCIKESQRLYPTVPFVFRRLTEPLVLNDGRVIPPETTVYISMSGLHLNPTVWDNPQVFCPERFSPENSASRSPHAFLPFSAGPRNCLGQQFAMFELKTTFAILLRHFVFSADETKTIKLFNAGCLRSETGIHVVMIPRDKMDEKD